MKIDKNEVILFQGDSITDGNRGRTDDPNHIHGHGYQYILSAKMYIDNLDKNITCINRGISGNRIADLYGRWKEDCLNLNPTLLSILIGVNDVWFSWDNQSGSDSDRYEKIYRLLLDEVRTQNPNIKLVILEPFFEKLDESERSLFFDKHVRTLAPVAKKIAEEYGAIFVPLQEMFDSFRGKIDMVRLIWDGVHPTTAGHELIARQWIKYAGI